MIHRRTGTFVNLGHKSRLCLIFFRFQICERENEFVFRFSYFTSEKKTQLSFLSSLFKTKNNSFFVRKFENEKTKDTDHFAVFIHDPVPTTRTSYGILLDTGVTATL